MARARAMPEVGRPVIVLYLGARASGVVQQVGDGGRRLEIVTAEGETLTFTLSRATGRFRSTGAHADARLVFVEQHDPDPLGQHDPDPLGQHDPDPLGQHDPIVAHPDAPVRRR